MILQYNDLKVDLLNKETQESSGIKELVSSVLANNLIIKDDNPRKGHELYKAGMYYIRNPNRFIFNYTWKTLFSGIKKTVGLDNEKTKHKK